MPTTTGSEGRLDRRLGYCVLGSLLAHLLLVGLWRGDLPQGTAGQSTFEVTLLARRGNAGNQSVDSRPAETPPATFEQHEVPRQQSRRQVQPKVDPSVNVQTARRAERRQVVVKNSAANARPASGRPVTETERPAAKLKHEQPARRTRQTNAPVTLAAGNTSAATPSARSGSVTTGQHALSSEARYSQVRAALFAALLPAFDYPLLARRRGWQGRVRVGLHVEADGDLIDIHLVESSGYDLLDDAAIKDILELRNVPAAKQWLDNRGMDVVLPVSYLLTRH